MATGQNDYVAFLQQLKLSMHIGITKYIDKKFSLCYNKRIQIGESQNGTTNQSH